MHVDIVLIIIIIIIIIIYIMRCILYSCKHLYHHNKTK